MNPRRDTHHHPEVLQVLELGEVFLQLWLNGLVLDLGIFEESPELFQSVQLTCSRGDDTSLICVVYDSVVTMCRDTQ